MISLFYRKLYPVLLLLNLAALSTACAPGLPRMVNVTPAVATAAPNLSWSGAGSGHAALPSQPGPAILHITAARGSSPFQIDLSPASGKRELVNAIGDTTGTLDEYRGVDLTSPVSLDVTGDRAWKIELLPPDPQHFPTLRVPGTFTSRGSAAILIQGKYSIAIFSTNDLKTLQAWAYGPGVSAPLSFKVDGDYKGRAVLPENTRWIVVSAPAPWSMEVQLPCCEIPPESK
jgi:hypothetical protein